MIAAIQCHLLDLYGGGAKLKRPKVSLTRRPGALALDPVLAITHIAFNTSLYNQTVSCGRLYNGSEAITLCPEKAE